MVGLGRLRDGWLCPGTVAHSFLYTSYYDILRTQTAAPSLRLAGPYTIQYASAVKMVGLSSSGGFRSPETRSFQLPARVPTQWCWTQRCDMQTTGWDRQPTGCDVHTTATGPFFCRVPLFTTVPLQWYLQASGRFTTPHGRPTTWGVGVVPRIPGNETSKVMILQYISYPAPGRLDLLDRGRARNTRLGRR